MAIIKEKVIKEVTLLDVKPGDVFEWVKEAGCRKVGELAVVKSVHSSGSIEFYPFDTSGNYGDVKWLEKALSEGNCILRQTSEY